MTIGRDIEVPKKNRKHITGVDDGKPRENTDYGDVSKPEEVAFYLCPTPGRIIVQEDVFQERSRIITPDNAKRRPTTGKILAIGENCYDMLKVGERVVYGLYSGTVINFKDKPAFRILGQDEVLSIVKGADLILEGVGA